MWKNDFLSPGQTMLNMKTFKIFFFFFLAISFSLNANSIARFNNCPPPQNVLLLSASNNSISFDWDDCGCASQIFQLHFIKNGIAGNTFQTNNSEFTFSDLDAGNYDFYFYSNCGGVLSAPIIVEDFVLQ